MLLSHLYFMVREMTKKHLAAINRGRKAAGLKPIRMKKKTTKKVKEKMVIRNGKKYPAKLFKTTKARQKAAKEIAEYKKGLHRAGTRKFTGMND